MVNLPTPPQVIEMSDSAVHALTKLSQRSPNDLALLKSLWTEITNTLDRKASFFLRVPTSQYDPVPKTRRAILQDTGALLTMPEDFARLVLWKIEGRIDKLSREDTSDEQWKKVETLSARLVTQHPDHVTNVFRLWQEVMCMKGKEVQETTVKDLRLLFQHRHAEAVVIMDKLAVQMDVLKAEDEHDDGVEDKDQDDWKIEE